MPIKTHPEYNGRYYTTDTNAPNVPLHYVNPSSIG